MSLGEAKLAILTINIKNKLGKRGELGRAVLIHVESCARLALQNGCSTAREQNEKKISSQIQRSGLELTVQIYL